MECKTLEINVISAKGLKDSHLFSKMGVYVVVSLSGDKQSAKTEVDRKGGTSPSWNFLVKFNIDEYAARQKGQNLEFKLRRKLSLFGYKDIGVVYVPVAELLVYTGDGKSMQEMSCQVTRPSGKPHGILNFSCKFMEKVATGGELLVPEAKAHEPVIAYAAPVVGTSALPYDGYPPAAGPHPPYCYGYPLPPAGSGYPPLVPEAKAHEPVTAYPAPVVGTSALPYNGSYPPAAASHPPPPPPYGYGNPPPPPGYGYPGPPPPGYGYQPAVQQPQNMNKFAMELGAGLVGRVIVGMLPGPDAGWDAGFGDLGGF